MYLLCPAQEKMSIRAKGITIRAVMDIIRQKTGYAPFYEGDPLQDAPRVDLDLHEADFREVLNACFAGLRLHYALKGKTIYITRDSGEGIYLPLLGRVQSASGQPLAGATISVGGVSRQSSSADGGFQLTVRSVHTVLTVSCIGYATARSTCSNSRGHVNVITLQRSAVDLDAAVVQAYGQTSERLKVGSVTAVRGEDIRRSGASTIWDGLTGRVPGLDIRQMNGVPGSAPQVLLRGQRSLANGNNLLIVVDGVPLVDNDGYMTMIGWGSAQGTTGASVLNGISPDDIASVEVLKDASATAIYGSRGASGVLLITLRAGCKGKLRFHASVSSGIDRVIKTSRPLNTAEYLAMREEAVENDGNKVSPANVPEAFNWNSTRSTNFQQLVMGHPRWRQDVSVGMSGGDSNTIYLLSGSYHREAAVFPGLSWDQRISVFGHVHEQSDNRRLQINLSAIYHWENNRLPQQDYSLAQYLAPNTPSFYSSTGQPQWSQNGLAYFNIPAQGYNSYSGYVQNQFNHLQVSYDALPGLQFRGSLGYYRIASTERTVNPIIGQDPAQDPTGSTGLTTNNGHSVLVEQVGEHKQHLGRGQLDLLAGVNWQEQRTSYSTQTASGYTSDLLMSAGSGKPVVTVTGNSIVYRYEALFGRLNYNLDNRYIAELSGRRDGSSRFGPGNQFGNFWAASAAWIFGDEPWFPSWRWFSFGKLRGSLGTTGNDQIGANYYAQVYAGTSAPQGYQGQQGLLPATVANNNLRWEVNYNSELEMDLGFVQNKILLSVATYRDWTVNQLLQTKLPGQSGMPNVYANVPANVNNRGVEFTLRTVNLRGKDFSWESTVTLSAPVNKLRRFPGLVNNTLYSRQLVVGKSLSVVKGYQYQGVSVDSGLFQFRDVNHDGVLDNNDFVVGGNFDPRYYGGVDQHFRYKRLELDLFVVFKRQNGYNPYVILYQQYAPGSLAPSMLGNAPVEWLHRWQHPGDHSALEKVTAATTTLADTLMGYYISSDAKVIDASYLRLKSVSFSYQLSSSWLKRLSLTEGKVYIKGENLFTYSHFPVGDPETQDPRVLPPVKTVTVGVTVNF
jgi:TonB-linked SusC/RagA family outer membrane protein